MNSTSLQFETPDLARWLWIALGAALLLEASRLAILWARGQRRGPVPIVFTPALLLLGIWMIARPGAGHLRPICGLALVLLLWGLRSYRRTTRDVSPSLRTLLATIRIAAILCVLVMMSGPVLQHTRQLRERSAVVILLDDSGSMKVRDVVSTTASNAAAASRLEAVETALKKASDSISRAGDDLDLHWLQFGDAMEEVRGAHLSGHGNSTTLFDSVFLAQTQFSAAQQRLAGVVVISDGRDNASARDRDSVIDAVGSSGVPLFAFGVGSDVPAGQTRSLIARRLDCPPRASLLNAFAIHAEFYAAGLAGTAVELELLYDDEMVQHESARPTQTGELLSFDVSHIPTNEGLHHVVARARTRELPGERGVAALSAYIQVVNDERRVLYLDRPRYERAAVGRALAGAKDFHLTRMDLQPAGKRDPIDWQPFAAVLLGDIDRNTLSPREIEQLRTGVVEDGKGVALLGGTRTLGSGGLSGSALVELFPVDLGDTGQINEKVLMQVTPSGRGHPILQPAPGTNPLQFWSGMPPFDGASLLGGVRPAAQVLLQSQAGPPLLVVQELGRGRTAVVAFDSSWRWSLSSPIGADAQRRFWRQLVLWLANPRPKVWVTVEKPRYLLNQLRSGGDHVIIRSGVGGAMTKGLDITSQLDVRLTAPASRPTGRSAASQPVAGLSWTRLNDVFESRPDLTAAGEYKIRVSAKDDSGALGEAEAAFVVESPDLESSDPLADPRSLKQLAEATSRQGGAFLPLDKLSEVFDRFTANAQAATTEQVDRSRLVADHPWPWLVAFAALLTLEWIIRRRVGLV